MSDEPGTQDKAGSTGGPRPEPLRFFGTTWVEHDNGYALRRAAVAVGSLVAAVASCLVLRFAYEGLRIADTGAFVMVLVVVMFAVCSALAFRTTWDSFSRRPDPDVAKLILGIRKVQKQAGSLGDAFAEELRRADAMHDGHLAFREALAMFCDRIRKAGGLPLPGEKDPSGRRGPSHLLSNPRAGGGAKRLFLFLRWMMRPADGIDLGLWSVPPSRLLMPVDVHIHKLSRNLGFTKRKDVSWKTAVEITEALARFDPSDPTRYDFSLCHMGMLQRCPSKCDEKRCEGCGVKPVCAHWRKKPLRTA